MAISKVTSASITTDAVGPTQLNEASNYDFTGTVTGAGGITNFDQWMMSANKSHGSASTWIDITADLQRMTYGGAGAPIGTGMTESSGIFSFPSIKINTYRKQRRKSNLDGISEASPSL